MYEWKCSPLTILWLHTLLELKRDCSSGLWWGECKWKLRDREVRSRSRVWWHEAFHWFKCEPTQHGTATPTPSSSNIYSTSNVAFHQNTDPSKEARELLLWAVCYNIQSRLGNDPIRIDPDSILDRITRIRIGSLRSIQDWVKGVV